MARFGCSLLACRLLLRGLPPGYHSYFKLQMMLYNPLLPIDLWQASCQIAIYAEQIKFCHRLKFVAQSQVLISKHLCVSYSPESASVPTE